MRHLAADKMRHVHLDATGSIITQPKELNSATIYYYALIMPGNKKNVGPLPIAEFISAKHDVTAIQHFLDVFNQYLNKISTQKINKVETDFSLALLQSACKAFNGMNLSLYIQYMYDKYEKNIKTDVKVTVLHVCSSHFIKTVCQKTKKCYPKEQKHIRFIATSLMAKMLHCECVSAAAEVYVVFVTLFGLKNKYTDFNQLVSSVKIIVEDVSSDSTSYISPETEESGISYERKASPYYQAFQQIKINVLNRCSTIPVSNPFFSADFFEYVTEFLLPYFPLWSAVAIAQFGLSRDSNAPIENYFKILKHNILDGETRIPAPRFITKNLSIIQARLKERQFPHTTSRQKRKIELLIPDDEETAEETWQRHKKQRVNRFLKYPKNIPVYDNDTNMNLENDEPMLREDERSPERSEKCKPSRYVDNIATADEVLFNKNMTYPQGFPNIKKDINGFVIEPQSFKTLMPFKSNDEYLDDNVINAFFSFLPNIAKKKISLLSALIRTSVKIF